jgi:hypothetical protein
MRLQQLSAKVIVQEVRIAILMLLQVIRGFEVGATGVLELAAAASDDAVTVRALGIQIISDVE